MAIELNLDGLVGPTHCHAGLSFGNLASMHHKFHLSNPQKAALEGLEKMWLLTKKGVMQGVMPPQERPFLPAFKNIGFKGTDEEILAKALKEMPDIFFSFASSSSMWTANAATVSPSSDSADGKMHITPANLISKLHRMIETSTTEKILKSIFPDEKCFIHHPPLISHPLFSDEGAANHTRFCDDYGKKGVQLFIYGNSNHKKIKPPKKYPPRQTFEASKAIAKLHLLDPKYVIFAQQNPHAIDQGVFHNDVISVGNQNFFFYHEEAFANPEVVEEISRKFDDIGEIPLITHKVESKSISLEQAVKTYLFNSQIVTKEEGGMLLIAPIECEEDPIVNEYLNSVLIQKNSPVQEIIYVNLRESMENGGGPACLRLRVVLTPLELKQINPNLILTESLYETLKNWIKKHYRDRLHPTDLADSELLQESRKALDELTQILQLGKVFEFQT